MAISRVLSSTDTTIKVNGTSTASVSGTIKQYDYAIVHIVSWHRTDAVAPVLSAVSFYDNTFPTRTITLSQIATQTRNEAIADGGYCTITSFGGQYTGSSGDITSGRVEFTFTGPSELDAVFTTVAVYRGVPYQSSAILGTYDDNNGDGTTHDYGSVTTTFNGAWANLFAVAWDTTTNMGTYTLDDPSGFTSLLADDWESTPGTNYTMFWEMWDTGPITAGTTTPSPDDSSTNACQWMTVLIPFYAADSYPMDGGMGVLF